MLHAPLARLEQNPVIEVMAKEVLGINVPKTVVTRSGDEFFDVAVNEAGNTAAFFGGGYLLEKLIDWVQRGSIQAEKALGSVAEKTAVAERRILGKSLALSAVLFSMMWAMPFIRNYLTAVRTGTADYTEVIGSGIAGAGDPRSSFERQQAFEQKKKGYLRTALATLGLGAGVAVASLWAFRTGGKGATKPLQGIGKYLLEKIGLEGGKFKNFGNIHAALFWGIPAYGGWIHASRDGYEAKEQWLKAANFFVWFFGLPMLMRGAFFKRFPKAMLDFAKSKGLGGIKHAHIEEAFKAGAINAAEKASSLKLWGWQNVSSLLASITLLGVSPALLNIWLTDRRLAQHRQAHTRFAAAPLPNSVPMQRRSFEGYLAAVQQGAHNRQHPATAAHPEYYGLR